MPNDLTLSEVLDANAVVEQPKSGDRQLDNFDYENTVVVPPQEVNDDIITVTIRDDELPDAVLKAVLLGLAEEQQALKNARVKKEKKGEADVTRLCLSRGTLLKYMSETLIQRQALIGGAGDLDLKGPKFREIIKMFLGVIADTFEEVKIPAEYKDLFFHALGKNLEGWENRAEKILKTVRC